MGANINFLYFSKFAPSASYQIKIMSYTIENVTIDVDDVVEIAKEAGKIIMEIYEQDTEVWSLFLFSIFY